MTLTSLPATELATRVRDGAATARAVTEAFLARIDRHDGALGAFLRADREHALAQADAVDRKRAAGETLGPLAGVPVALKDLISERGQPLTCGSKILEPHVARYDACVTERLRDADAVLIGHTNMDEFAMGSTTETSAFGPTKNPWDLERFPGGSSGGSAAAVAARLAPLALGSETGGSVRQPASLCGVLGLKPTYGRVSRYGLVSYGSSLDQVAPFAWNADDLALLLGVIAGHDERDSTSAPEPVGDYRDATAGDVRGLRVGVPAEFFGDGVADDVQQTARDTIDRLAAEGADVREISLPHTEYGIPVYYLIATSEASSNLARYDGVHYGRRAADAADLDALYTRSRGEGFGHEVKKRIVLGTFALSAGYYDAYYKKAQQVRTLIRHDFTRAFESVDVLVGPTAPTTAGRLGSVVDDAMAMYMMDVLTVTTNLAGIPGVSLPGGFSADGLPIGVQVLAKPYDEATLFRVAGTLGRLTDHHRKEPAL